MGKILCPWTWQDTVLTGVAHLIWAISLSFTAIPDLTVRREWMMKLLLICEMGTKVTLPTSHSAVGIKLNHRCMF